MGNKKIWLKAILFLGSVAGFSVSFAPAAWFNINLGGAGIQAINLEAVTKNVMPIHFVDNGNDFGGFLYIQSGSTAPCSTRIGNVCGEYITFQNGSGYICQQQVRGFYYNSERGERLWPLDDETWRDLPIQNGLTVMGGLYTRCISEELAAVLNECANGTGDDEAQCEADARNQYGNLYGYYGEVRHDYDGDIFGLIAGAKYSRNGSSWISIDTEDFSESFIRYDNTYPVGLLYDYNGGVGFVGCEFTTDKTHGLNTFVDKLNNGYTLNELFEEDFENESIMYTGTDISLNCTNVGYAANSLIKMVIDGLVGMGRGSDLSLIGNQTNTKMQYFTSVNVSNTMLVNYAKKKAESLCRGKWINYDERNDKYGQGWREYYGFDTWYEMYRRWKEEPEQRKERIEERYNKRKSEGQNKPLICVEGDGRTIFAEPGKTYILKGDASIFVPVMSKFEDDDYYYDIFVMDDGSILFDNVSAEEKRVFTRDGFISEASLGEFTQEVDDAICSIKTGDNCIGNYDGENVAVGAFIKGNFIINGHLQHMCNEKILERDSFIKDMGLCDEGVSQINSRYFIYGKFTTKDSGSNLEKLFSRRCLNGLSSDPDEKYCPLSLRSGAWVNPYENAFLVVIDQNYDSPLFKS